MLRVAQKKDNANTSDKFPFVLVGIFHALNTVQGDDKHKNLLEEICLDYAYLIIDLGDKYVGNWNNNTTHFHCGNA